MYFYCGIKHDSKLRMQIEQKITPLKLKLILIDLSKERKIPAKDVTLFVHFVGET